MSFATTNTAIWKEIATEKEDTARTMARVALGLFLACNVLAVTAFSAHTNYSSICSFVDERQKVEAEAYEKNEVTQRLKADYCS